MAKDPRFDPKILNSKKEDKLSSAEIANSSILTTHIADNSITTAKIEDNSITTAKIANSNITTAKIADNSVTTAKIADSQITTVKIADAQITDAKMTTGVQQRLANTFTKKQIVHRRILFGAQGSLSGTYNVGAFTHSSGYYGGYSTGISRFMYGPYGYGTPGIQTGAERRTRIYAIWSDNIQNQVGYFEMRITIILSGGGTYAYTLGSTWGDTTTPRDGYSNELVGLPPGNHGTIYFHVEGYSVGYPPSSGQFHYVELQHLDVFP